MATICPVCSGPATVRADFDRDGQDVECPACGRYKISESLLADLSGDPRFGTARFILSGLTRRASDAKAPLHLKTTNVWSYIEGAPVPRDPFDALEHLLLVIRQRVTGLSGYVRLTSADYPLIFARDAQEFTQVVNYLKELGYVTNPGDGRYLLTLAGWKRADELFRGNPSSTQAFVAMSFAADLAPIWRQGIAPAITSAGFSPLRVDAVEHNGKICDRIVAEIRRSRFVVSDFSHHRAGVYFEAGFAMGLGLPVIWMCQQEDIASTHFDTRQYNHIVWQDAEDLQRKLRDRILATIPGAVLTQTALGSH